jgi:DMSO/TMAO reductase YedYZ molybdopterin-dependent catalytic subunit
MSAGAVNLGLFAAVPALAATGLLAWAFPTPAGDTILVAHRVIASSLLLLLAWKQGIARRSIARRLATGRGSTLATGTLASGALLVTLGLGLAWTTGLVSFDRPFAYSALNLHVIAGIALVPLAVAHAAQREPRLAPSTPRGRRDALLALAVALGGVVLATGLARIDPLRRPTGSRRSATLVPTSWTFDAVPAVDASRWRMTVRAADAAARTIGYDELLAIPPVEREATLDCTGGWWSVQRWRGVPLAALVRTDRGVRVASSTGHAWTFAANEIAELLLATHVAGEPLAPEHGYPVRLVAPGHRGFTWVKWVERIEVV